MSSSILWTFVVFQAIIDLYFASLVVYGFVQKRRHGTFNPLSPLQHKDLQQARQLLYEFKSISQRTAHLLERLQQEQQALEAKMKIPAVEMVAAQKPIGTAVPTIARAAEPPVAVLHPPMTPAPARSLQIRNLLQQGISVEEICSQLRASREEVHLIRSLNL